LRSISNGLKLNMAKAKNKRRISAIEDFLWENGASTASTIANGVRNKGRQYDMLNDTVAQLCVGNKNIQGIGNVRYQMGALNLWELTPAYRKERCEAMLDKIKEMRKELGKLKSNLHFKQKKISRLESQQGRKKRKTPKSILKSTMELWDTHGEILSILADEPKSTSEILRSKNIQYGRVTLLRRLREMEAKKMVTVKATTPRTGRGRRFVWTITEHDPYNHTGEVLRWI